MEVKEVSVPDWKSWAEVVVDTAFPADDFAVKYPQLGQVMGVVGSETGDMQVKAALVLGAWYFMKFRFGSMPVVLSLLETVAAKRPETVDVELLEVLCQLTRVMAERSRVQMPGTVKGVPCPPTHGLVLAASWSWVRVGLEVATEYVKLEDASGKLVALLYREGLARFRELLMANLERVSGDKKSG